MKTCCGSIVASLLRRAHEALVDDKGSIAHAQVFISHLIRIYQNDLFDMHMISKYSSTLYVWATKITLLNEMQ